MSERKVPKPPQALVEAFDRALPVQADRKQMFGCPCAFVGGNMFAGLFGGDVFVRLPDEQRAELVAGGGGWRHFEPMGRPMRGYVVLPETTAGDHTQLGDWLGRAFAHGANLPPKEPKPKAPKKVRAPKKG